MSDIPAGADALVTFQMVKWLAAHCDEHDGYTQGCPRCDAKPQSCAKHPRVNGTFPGFDLGCKDCAATRPGHETIGEVGNTVMTAEEACITYKIPYQTLRSGRTLRIPLNVGGK